MFSGSLCLKPVCRSDEGNCAAGQERLAARYEFVTSLKSPRQLILQRAESKGAFTRLAVLKQLDTTQRNGTEREGFKSKLEKLIEVTRRLKLMAQDGETRETRRSDQSVD